MQPTPAALIAALLTGPPHALGQIDAELLFVAGQYLFHSHQDGADHYKFLAPEAVRAAFATLPIDTGWLDPSIQRWGTGADGPWVGAWHPPAVTPLAVILEHPTRPTSLRVPLPGLVLVGHATRYYLCATATSVFDPQAALYRAPLPNVYPDGRICWGTATPPPPGTATIRTAWEVFCGSVFNGDLCSDKSRAQRSDVRAQLQALAAAGAETYPPGDLLTYGRGSLSLTGAAAVEIVITPE